MVAIDRVGYVYPSVHLQEMLNLAQKPAPLATPTQYGAAAINSVLLTIHHYDFQHPVAALLKYLVP
jgi:hypothetical protein